MSLALVTDRVAFLLEQAAGLFAARSLLHQRDAEQVMATVEQRESAARLRDADESMAREMFLVVQELRNDFVLLEKRELEALRALQRRAPAFMRDG